MLPPHETRLLISSKNIRKNFQASYDTVELRCNRMQTPNLTANGCNWISILVYRWSMTAVRQAH